MTIAVRKNRRENDRSELESNAAENKLKKILVTKYLKEKLNLKYLRIK